jgi:hypothetical protein
MVTPHDAAKEDETMTKGATAIQLAIRDAAQAVFALYRAEGLRACQDHDYLPDAARAAEEAVEGPERDAYTLAYTTAAECIVAQLPGMN